VEGFSPVVMALAVPAGLIVKYVVDSFKTEFAMKRWATPMLAMVVGVLVAVLIMEASGTPINGRQSAAQAILGGIVAAVFASGGSAMQAGTKKGA
jgi:peptidoglycan/LPS O-acetylase OafA/YrhL